MTPGHVEGTGPFFVELGEVLEAVEAAELRRRIIGYARGLDRSGRQRLLAALDAPVEHAGGGAGREAASTGSGDIANDPLVRHIEGFRQRVEAREYMDGWGWDPEIRDERAWGDESWAVEMAIPLSLLNYQGQAVRSYRAMCFVSNTGNGHGSWPGGSRVDDPRTWGEFAIHAESTQVP